MRLRLSTRAAAVASVSLLLTAAAATRAAEQAPIDSAGCYAVTDTAGGSAAYAFSDISVTGTAIPLGDDVLSAAVPIGFAFEYYGVEHEEAFVSSNGFLTFRGGQTAGCCSGQSIPSVVAPNELVAGLWTDLFPSGGQVLYETLGNEPERRFVVQFAAVALRNEPSRTGTWQFVLEEGSNRIEVHYQSVDSGGSTATAGIENVNGLVGFQWAGPTAIELEEEAVFYSPQPLLLADTDSDGRRDCLDNCTGAPNAGQHDCDGDGGGDACDEDSVDIDSDDVDDSCDNCAGLANAGQQDGDGDGFGDACDTCVNDGASDADGDTVCDAGDNCVLEANPEQTDSDLDGQGDACDPCYGYDPTDADDDGFCDGFDNCPDLANPEQADCDRDDVGDLCDPDGADTDGDEIADACDNCPTAQNPDQVDHDHDEAGDACDTCAGPGSSDEDGDELCLEYDNCPATPNPGQVDCDEDAIGDACDSEIDPAVADDDVDGHCDDVDNCLGLANDQGDRNGDGVGDACELQGKLDSAGCYRSADTVASPDGTEPEFVFEDISNIGTELPVLDQPPQVLIPLGFDFEFYGQSYSELYVSRNGFVTFLAGAEEDQTGTIPSPYGANAVIAAQWGWLSFFEQGSMLYATLGDAPQRRFVLEFLDVEQVVNPNGPNTWEIVLFEGSNEVVVRYLDAASAATYGLAGIEDHSGEVGLLWAGPRAIHLQNDAVLYAPTSALLADADGDGLRDCLDNCSSVFNAGQLDCDEDDIGDACDPDTVDSDTDGVDAACDNCVEIANTEQADVDDDGHGDACDECIGEGPIDLDSDLACDDVDNCLGLANPDQLDTDDDGIGNACDHCVGIGATDFDLDGDCDPRDNCIALWNPDQRDCENDGVGDACDPDLYDTDGDGVPQLCDRCPDVADADQADTDFDYVGDACDACVGSGAADQEGDGICDGDDNCYELANPDQVDDNGNGDGDACEIQGRLDRKGCYVVNDTVAPADGNEPVFEFIDISATGTVVAFDLSGVPVPIGFDFKFYDESHSDVHVGYRGALTFTAGQHSSFPKDYIAADNDGHCIDHGEVRYQLLGSAPLRRFVVQYTDQDGDCPGGSTLQIVLVEGSNDILVEYLDVEKGEVDAGIANDDVTSSLRWSGFDSAHLVEDVVRYRRLPAVEQDSDGDGLVDCLDNCPVANPAQEDSDGDGFGDPCDDCEGRGAVDEDDDGNCDPPRCETDTDSDSVCDENDNCPNDSNPWQEDCDRDPSGDVCDPDTVDSDSDGIDDSCDNCVGVSNPDQADRNGDRIADACAPPQREDNGGCYVASDTLGPPAEGDPVYEFMDISASGTQRVWNYFDEDDLALPIGFDFEFYGECYAEVVYSGTGLLTFVPGQRGALFWVVGLPSPRLPNATISALWNLSYPSSAELWHQTLGDAPNRRFVLQSQAGVRLGHFAAFWQIILFEGSNEIQVHYLENRADRVLSSGGIEDASGTVGLRWAGPNPSELNEVAVRYRSTSSMTSDFDADGTRDCLDNCPLLGNADQRDSDRDGIGAACQCDADSSPLDPICGDANGDCELTVTDGLTALRAAVGATHCAVVICDWSGSGGVDTKDALGILRSAVGLPSVANCPAPAAGLG